MGRRKERRIAAMSNAGRRVKLDLFEEPSGDLGGYSAQDKVGEESDSKTQSELPSTGKKQQNPLSLLEQYSDEEMDEGLGDGKTSARAEDASAEVDDKQIVTSEVIEDLEDHEDETAIQCSEEIQMDNGVSLLDRSQKLLEKENPCGHDSEELERQVDKIDDTTPHASADEQFNGAVVSGWKMVLHEESNQYYYWNIATGETSWDVPEAFALATRGTLVGKDDDDAVVKTDVGTVADKTSAPSHTEQGKTLGGSNEEFEGFSDVKELRIDSDQSYEMSLLGKYSLESEGGINLFLQLVDLGESLLERLKSLKGLNSNEVEDLKSKYMLEAEIRLGDIKALSSHASSLLPFWQHLEGELKRLDAAVNDLTERQNYASTSGFEAAPESIEGIGNNIEIDSGAKKESSPPEQYLAESIKSNYESHDDDGGGGSGGGVATNHIPLAGKGSGDGIGNETEETLRPGFHCEDVDMDVDMDVEDTSPVGVASSANLQASTDASNLQNTHTTKETAALELVHGGPPLEEWIPPPPPDNEPFPPPPPDEPFPPPPPDEPPETLQPPSSHFDSVQTFPYSQQYAVSYDLYPGSGLTYYGQTNTEISGSALFALPEGGLVAVPQVPNYYDTSTNSYGMVINQVEPMAYYGLQNEIVNPAPLIGGEAVHSFGTKHEPTSQSLPSAVSGSLNSQADYGSKVFSKTDHVNTIPGHDSIKSSVEIQTSVSAPVVSSLMNSASVLSTSDASTSAVAAAASTSSKAQPKATRGKKRTVAVVSTLRSNKKVSSLVDKWKAAKEELEEDEEPDPIEILERKRQREIEEWKAQQIASGEAKDNANFQPLGGDWRERVKRKRAERMKEPGQSSSEDRVQQQLDLIELSKGLPSGWQAYWDEASKQVYYGNTLTSETTWDRPSTN